MNTNPKAFTLAETLIILAIIGIVAALTIPNLLQKYQERETVSGVSKAYLILQNAFKNSERENGPVKGWDIGQYDTANGAELVSDYILPYLKVQKHCGISTGCWANTYKNLQGETYAWQPNTHYTYGGRAILNDGMSLYFRSNGSGCTDTNGTINICFLVGIDINGLKGPNRAGVDFFLFVATENGIIPAGTKGHTSPFSEIDCQHNSNKSANGLYCTAWVFYKKNTNYLKKDISWD